MALRHRGPSARSHRPLQVMHDHSHTGTFRLCARPSTPTLGRGTRSPRRFLPIQQLLRRAESAQRSRTFPGAHRNVTQMDKKIVHARLALPVTLRMLDTVAD